MFHFRPHSRRINDDFVCSIRHGLASLDGRVPNEFGEERENNGVPQEKEDNGHVSLSEGNSVTEMDIVEDNEDNSGAVQGELSNLSDESLPAITKNQRRARR